MGTHNLPDELQNQHAEFPASGRGMWITGIGFMLAWGTTVPGDDATGYGKGCKFFHTDGANQDALIYVNVADRTASKFRQQPVADLAGTAGGAGPSPLIWDGSLWNAVQNDPTLGFAYFDDFLGPIDVTTGDGYTITQVTSGAISAVEDEDGGVLLVDSAGNASADDGVNVQLKNCMFKPVAGRTIRFEARVKFNDNSALTSQFAIGLAGVSTALIASGAIEDTVDKCLWFHHGASTADKMSVICSRTSANDTDADKATTVDDTYIKLGFVINGLTSVQWYADGVLVHTSNVAAQIPNAVMCLSFVAQTEGASKDAEMSVDWVRILQEGTRS